MKVAILILVGLFSSTAVFARESNPGNEARMDRRAAMLEESRVAQVVVPASEANSSVEEAPDDCGTCC